MAEATPRKTRPPVRARKPKSNAQKCQEWRSKQDTTIKFPTPPGIRAMLDELKAWHDFEDDRELLDTFVRNLHALGRDGSAAAFAVTRHGYTPPPARIAEWEDDGLLQRPTAEQVDA